MARGQVCVRLHGVRRQLGARSIAVVPLQFAGQGLGAIIVLSHLPQAVDVYLRRISLDLSAHVSQILYTKHAVSYLIEQFGNVMLCRLLQAIQGTCGA